MSDNSIPTPPPAPGTQPPGLPYPGTAGPAQYGQPAAGAAMVPASGYPANGYAAPEHTAPGYAAPGYMAPGYAAPGYGAPVYAPRPNSGLAITSLVCGIAGLVLAAFLLPLIASVVAVITGHMSLSQIKSNPALGGKGLGITGLVLGYAGLAVLLIMIVAFVFSLLVFGSLSFLPFFFM